MLALNLPVDQVTSSPWARGDKNRRRDLPGLRRFINETRGEESGTVGQNLSNLFGANWAVITDPRHMRGFDATANEHVAHSLRRLETAARGDPNDLLKQEAL